MNDTNRHLPSCLLAFASICALGVAGCAAKYNNAAGLAPQAVIILWNTNGPAQPAPSYPVQNPVTNPNPPLVQPAPVVTLGTIYSSTPLGPNELNATASTTGMFVYTPAEGTFLTPGVQTLSVTFTPYDTTNYMPTTRTVQIQVNDITAASSQPSLAPEAVQIIGGGYVDGVFFHPLQKDLRYVRTDVGGAYRWVSIPYQQTVTINGVSVTNPCQPTAPQGPSLEALQSGNWVPLLDFLGVSDSGDMGVESLGLDPSDPKRLYLSTGLNYNNDAGQQNHFMLSDDQGATFTEVNAPFPINGNDNGRDAGERFGVDPNLGTTIYYGSRTAGLWKSLDRGMTWNQVTSFPVTGPTKGAGVVFVTFVPSSGNAGTATPVLYAGVSDYNYYNTDGSNNGTPTYLPIYRSVDAGATWQSVPGQPTSITNPSGGTTPTILNLTPIHGMLGADAVNNSTGSIYVTYFSDEGPGDSNNGGGAVYQYTPTPGTAGGAGTWTSITPSTTNSGRTSGANGGFSGLALDPELPGVIMVGTQDDYNEGDTIYRSLDYGQTWRDLKHTIGMVNDVGASPWLSFGGGMSKAVATGNWPSSIAIDPFDSTHVEYGTGQTLWDTQGSTGIEQADLGQPKQPVFEPAAYGAAKGGRVSTAACLPVPPVGPGIPGGSSIEETVVLALTSPPLGAPLISSVGDLGNFVHQSLDSSPAYALFAPQFTTGTSVDFAQNAPLTVVRVGSGSDKAQQSPYTPKSGAPAGTKCDSASNPSQNSNCVQITIPELFAYTVDGGLSTMGTDWTGTITISSAPNLKSVTSSSTFSSGGGTVAISPDALSTVWAPYDFAPSCTGSLNATPVWTPATGGIIGAQVVSDRVSPGVYYMYDSKSGALLMGTASIGSGTAAVPFQCNLTFTTQSTLPAYSNGQLAASFGAAGELFLAVNGSSNASANGLYHSTDFGKTLTQVSGFTEGYAIGFGAPATDAAVPAYSKPAIYTAATGASGYGFYRSIDDGATWLLVSNPQHLLGYVNAIVGDQRAFGRYYIGTSGRGIGYADTQ